MKQSTLDSIDSNSSVNQNTPIHELRSKRLEKDGYECSNCGATNDLEVHHIVPNSRGGVNELSNLRTLCVDCHSKTHNGSIGFIKNTENAHGNEKKTRWLPTVQTMQYMVSNIHHPLRKAVVMLMAKTGLGAKELVSLNLGDIYLRQGGVFGTSIIERPKRSFIFIESNKNRQGTAGRLSETHIPLDREMRECLKGWLTIRPDTDSESLFVYVSGPWGESISTKSVRNAVEKGAKRLNICETPGGENLNPTALVQFFKDRYNGQPCVRAYIVGKKYEPPMSFKGIMDDYREHIFKLDTGQQSWL